MKQFQFHRSTSKQAYLPALLSDENRHLCQGAMIWRRMCHSMEQELCVHCGWRPKLNAQTLTFYR